MNNENMEQPRLKVPSQTQKVVTGPTVTPTIDQLEINDDTDLSAIGLGLEEKKEETAKVHSKTTWNRSLPELIEEMIKKGIRLYLTPQGYEIEGFYKIGSIHLVPHGDQLLAIDKKEESVVIKSFDDLVKLNYHWWKKSRTRVAFASPEKPWEEEFLRLNLIKRQYVYSPND